MCKFTVIVPKVRVLENWKLMNFMIDNGKVTAQKVGVTFKYVIGLLSNIAVSVINKVERKVEEVTAPNVFLFSFPKSIVFLIHTCAY